MRNVWPEEWRRVKLKARGQAINKVYGNLTGLGAEQIRRIGQLYRRKVPPERIVTHELARQLTSLSREINRQIGILISRRGEIAYVIAGSPKDIMIPGLDGFRSSSTRFKGLRLIHTHLNGEGLTTDDLTDLALLRLDLISAVETGEDGLPGYAHTAHLIPENPDGRYWLIMEKARPSEMNLNFLAFIQALESEFAKKQKTRKVDSTDRAILIRVETNPLADSRGSLDELKELARSCGVEVFDSIIQYREQIDSSIRPWQRENVGARHQGHADRGESPHLRPRTATGTAQIHYGFYGDESHRPHAGHS